MTWRQMWSTSWGRVSILIALAYAAFALIGVIWLVQSGSGPALDKIKVLGQSGEFAAKLYNQKQESDRRSTMYFVDVEWVDETGTPRRQPETRISYEFYQSIGGAGPLTTPDTTVRIGDVAGRSRAVLTQDARRILDEANDDLMPISVIMMLMGLAVGGLLTLLIVKGGVKPPA